MPTPRMLHGDEATVYDQLHHRLTLAVRANVTATPQIHEDACSHAWLQFLRLQPNRASAYSWLCTVAIHEGWRLAKQTRRELALTHDPQVSAPVSSELALEAREALTALAGLPDRQRRYLTLLVAGLSYADITHHTGATHTNVNKHLVRARRQLRAVHHPDS